MGSALYTASSTASGGRQGSVKSSDGTLDLTLSLPKGLGGNEKEGTTNPEQLFSAGYACFDSALQMVAGQVKKKIISEVTADVSIEKQASGFGLSVNLTAKMEGVTQVEAEELMEKAHKACPYSRAIEGNVEVKKKAIGE
ncbi:organic hydroperoxide resistance protein [Oceanobacillus kimchii]|uniref:organic hydroperoxide resistance protein n=1 Tax=Oceanobacillus kimchii TaxID=746691 RepID=UPI00232D960E|nr:organic hydroperoxide resistance protein [Oceanobacillus kimchii]